MRSQPILTRTIARCLGPATLAVWSAVLLGTAAPSAAAQFETPPVLGLVDLTRRAPSGAQSRG